MSTIVQKALNYAIRELSQQVRRRSMYPSLLHAVEVAGFVSTFGAPDEVVAVAYLHDIYEDCGIEHWYRVKDIFGEEIANNIGALSMPPEGPTALIQYRNRISVCGRELQTVKVCDMASNMLWAGGTSDLKFMNHILTKYWDTFKYCGGAKPAAKDLWHYTETQLKERIREISP